LKARWIERWDGPLQAGRRAEPDLGRDEVLIEVEACGIGLTVLNCIRGDLGRAAENLPRIPGHELVGRIADCGESVNPRRVGERVVAYFYLFCGECDRCLAGAESLCLRLAGFVGVDCDGGYAERVVLPARNAIPLPQRIDPVDATTIPDAIATPVHAARRASIAPGERVAVTAAGGGVGIHMVQVARLHGADVIGLEIDESKRRYLDETLGVESLDSSDFEATELPARWAGEADVVVDLWGREPSLGWSLRVLGPGGRLVLLTTFPGIAFPVSPRSLVFSQTSILGSRYASRSEVRLAARLVAGGRITPVVGRRVNLGEVEDIHRDLQRGTLIGRGAMHLPAQ
jgi:D-arabinose 1-dehydrogenase-like Zn-dependent alcohol dehydrogenase